MGVSGFTIGVSENLIWGFIKHDEPLIAGGSITAGGEIDAKITVKLII